MTIYLIPVAGVLTGVAVLGEELTTSMITALVIITIGLLIVNRSNA